MTRRRSQGAILLAAVVALVVLLLSPASAARLNLSVRPLTVVDVTGCTTSSLVATAGVSSGTSTQVVLSGVPAACQGKAATLRLYAADGTALATADTSATLVTAGSTTVAVPSYAVDRVAGMALTVGTWGVPVTWTAPTSVVSGPVTPGAGTTFGALTWDRLVVSGEHACVSVPVSGTAGTTWRIDLHLDQRPFNGLTSGSGFVVSPYWAKVQNPTPVGGVVSIVGDPRPEVPGADTIQAGQTFTVSICHYQLPPPSYDPALSYTQTSAAATGNVGWACFATTIAVSGTPQFFAGWRAEVDVAPLAAWFAAQSPARTVQLSTVQMSQGGYALTALGGTRFRVEPTGWTTAGVRDGSPQTFSLCANST